MVLSGDFQAWPSLYFILTAHCSLRNTREHFSTRLEGHFKPKEKGTKNVKNVALNRLQRGHLFIVPELKQEGRALPSSTSAGSIHGTLLKFFILLHVSANDHEATAASVDLGLTNNF